MIRILVIGEQADRWHRRLASDDVDVDAARLPAAGIRQFEATPPDAVVIAGGDAARAATLVDALRSRPLGKLVPVVTVAPFPDDEAAVSAVDAWIPPEQEERVSEVLGELLGVDLAAAPARAAGPPPRPEASLAEASPAPEDDAAQPAYVIEEIDAWEGPRRLDREEVFQSQAPVEADGRLDEEAIRRKLREVRHEDYFTILEVRRGAEGPTVREAFHRQWRRFDAAEIGFELAHRYEDELLEIRDALEDAWAVLGDPKLRKDYLEHTTRAR